MKTLLKTVMACTALAAASPSLAASVLFDTFDTENGGNTAINYSGFAQFIVTSTPQFNGSVDLVRSGDYGITCFGGSGACIDLDGSTGAAGALRTRNALAVSAGDIVTLSFNFSGNQRGLANDSITFGFETSGLMDFTNISLALGSGGNFAFGDLTSASRAIFQFDDIASGDAWDLIILTFTAGSDGSIFGVIGDTGGINETPTYDYTGAVIDNFMLVSGAVPEPSTWAMMIGGFGLIGGAMRARRSSILRHTNA